MRGRLLLACARVKPESLFGKHLIVLAQHLIKVLLPLSTCHEPFLDLSFEKAILFKNRCYITTRVSSTSLNINNRRRVGLGYSLKISKLECLKTLCKKGELFFLGLEGHG